MRNKKIISIITPYYKGEKTIFNTIDSVFRAYKKVEDEFEIQYIVVIDSMEDKERISLKLNDIYGYKVTILKNEKNIGVADSRNNAAKVAKGDYMLFLDQDDNLGEMYFEAVKEKIKAGADLIVTNGYITNESTGKKTPLYYIAPALGKKTLLRANKISTPGQVLFSKKIGKIDNLFAGCSADFKGADDWAAYVNIYIKFPDLKVAYVKDKIFYYNLHGNNYSNNWQELNQSAIETSKYFIDKVSEEEKKILNKRIKILEFENEYLDHKNLKYKLHHIGDIANYYAFHLVYLNRIIGILHKKSIGFYK